MLMPPDAVHGYEPFETAEGQDGAIPPATKSDMVEIDVEDTHTAGGCDAHASAHVGFVHVNKVNYCSREPTDASYAACASRALRALPHACIHARRGVPVTFAQPTAPHQPLASWLCKLHER